jgi:N-methylhydantoinase A
VLAFDMGGTTAKLALVDDGEPLVAWGFEAARDQAFPARVGAADADRHGRADRDRRRRRLDRASAAISARCNVGPGEQRRAARVPACYGRGGTDADRDRQPI